MLTESQDAASIGWRDRIFQCADQVRDKRPDWHAAARVDPAFVAAGGHIFPFDTLGANMGPMADLLETTGLADALERGEINTVCDIGCANGELSFAFALAGQQVTAIDWADQTNQAPTLVSSIAKAESLPVSVINTTVDRHFSFSELREAVVYDAGTMPDERFDLAVCFGLIYHLKNPFAFLESLAGIARYVIVGTHVITHAPNIGSRLDDHPLAYLVEPGELNSDPTNFWMFTEKGFHRLARRSGFKIVGSRRIAESTLGIAMPDRVDFGLRGFMVLESL